MKCIAVVCQRGGRESHPSRGAWIEILATLGYLSRCLVAPLTGCVD